MVSLLITSLIVSLWPQFQGYSLNFKCLLTYCTCNRHVYKVTCRLIGISFFSLETSFSVLSQYPPHNKHMVCEPLCFLICLNLDSKTSRNYRYFIWPAQCLLTFFFFKWELKSLPVDYAGSSSPLSYGMGSAQSCLSDSLRPHGLYPTRFLCQILRQEYWSGLSFPPPGDLPNPGIESGLLHCRQILLLLSHLGSPPDPIHISRLPSLVSGKESAGNSGDCLQCRRHWFDPQVRKIPLRRKWQPTPVCLPGKSHGQRSLAGYSPWGCKSQTQLGNYTTITTILILMLPGVCRH